MDPSADPPQDDSSADSADAPPTTFPRETEAYNKVKAVVEGYECRKKFVDALIGFGARFPTEYDNLVQHYLFDVHSIKE